MNINTINRYNKLTNESAEQRYLGNSSINKVQKSNVSNVDNKQEISSNLNKLSDKLITKQERNFFIKMFPDSQEQIKNHVLFTKSGKTTSPNISKGSIIDGRA